MCSRLQIVSLHFQEVFDELFLNDVWRVLCDVSNLAMLINIGHHNVQWTLWWKMPWYDECIKAHHFPYTDKLRNESADSCRNRTVAKPINTQTQIGKIAVIHSNQHYAISADICSSWFRSRFLIEARFGNVMEIQQASTNYLEILETFISDSLS